MCMHVSHVSDRRRDGAVIAFLFTIAVNALFLHGKVFSTVFLQDVYFLILLAVILGSCVALVVGLVFPIPCAFLWNIPVELTSFGQISMLEISSGRFLCSRELLFDPIFCLRVATSTTTVALTTTSALLDVSRQAHVHCFSLRRSHSRSLQVPHVQGDSVASLLVSSMVSQHSFSSWAVTSVCSA